MKALKLDRKEAIGKIAKEFEIGSDARHLIGYTENAEKGRFLYVDPQGRTWPSEYVGEHTFRLIDLMPEPFVWDGNEDNDTDAVRFARSTVRTPSADDGDYWEKYANAESAAKDEIEAELLDEYKHDSLIDPNGEDVKIVWV